ncbi:hypothetical protein JCGZ_10077 [Jatropha curcas]|uniref:BURP domain-containing protein n=1 Tax=Jatropha curcas TaxID=180498 RepID=A0A067LCZ5_JATCU|nr:uncharacterized protein LOC105632107 [Jatropha curcas]KDP46237.1 hypothetical protein JCGZ_10077 [Jatropha curcas]
MKLTTAFFLLVFLFSFVIELSYARKVPEEYWKSIMKEQPIPKAIGDLFIEEDSGGNNSNYEMDHFAKDFDTKAIAVIYHSHGKSKEDEDSDAKKQERSFVVVEPEIEISKH